MISFLKLFVCSFFEGIENCCMYLVLTRTLRISRDITGKYSFKHSSWLYFPWLVNLHKKKLFQRDCTWTRVRESSCGLSVPWVILAAETRINDAYNYYSILNLSVFHSCWESNYTHMNHKFFAPTTEQPKATNRLRFLQLE